MYTHCIKPGLDWLVALTALLVLTPFLCLIALLLISTTGSSPFFYQQRIGYKGRLFWMFKFRTMTNARDKAGELLPDAERTTPLGQWLRRTSLDELPQLFNVLLGQMSLVGPRPLLAEYHSIIAQHERHQVRPGLTGWAQIHGRNALSWEEKFTFDKCYVAHCHLYTDWVILLRTFLVLIDTSPPAQRLDAYRSELSMTPSNNGVER